MLLPPLNLVTMLLVTLQIQIVQDTKIFIVNSQYAQDTQETQNVISLSL